MKNDVPSLQLDNHVDAFEPMSPFGGGMRPFSATNFGARRGTWNYDPTTMYCTPSHCIMPEVGNGRSASIGLGMAAAGNHYRIMQERLQEEEDMRRLIFQPQAGSWAYDEWLRSQGVTCKVIFKKKVEPEKTPQQRAKELNAKSKKLNDKADKAKMMQEKRRMEAFKAAQQREQARLRMKLETAEKKRILQEQREIKEAKLAAERERKARIRAEKQAALREAKARERNKEQNAGLMSVINQGRARRDPNAKTSSKLKAARNKASRGGSRRRDQQDEENEALSDCLDLNDEDIPEESDDSDITSHISEEVDWRGEAANKKEEVQDKLNMFEATWKDSDIKKNEKYAKRFQNVANGVNSAMAFKKSRFTCRLFSTMENMSNQDTTSNIGSQNGSSPSVTWFSPERKAQRAGGLITPKGGKIVGDQTLQPSSLMMRLQSATRGNLLSQTPSKFDTKSTLISGGQTIDGQSNGKQPVMMDSLKAQLARKFSTQK